MTGHISTYWHDAYITAARNAYPDVCAKHNLAVGWKVTRKDGTTHNGYYWPTVNGDHDIPVLHQASAWDGTNRGSCPKKPGDGLCFVTSHAAPASSGGISLAEGVGHVLVFASSLARTDEVGKFRAPWVVDVDVFDPVQMIRQGFSSANLGLANLRSADLYSVDLRLANLGSADLRLANLCSADLSLANLGSADLRLANLSGANLSSANLGSANLSSANLRLANLRSADLSGANLSSANLGSANLGSADLSGANLCSADLRLANLYSANLSSANLSSADLSGANLCSANLRLANLYSANLRSANLRSAVWDEFTRWPAGYKPVTA